MAQLWVVIPTYNEQANLAELAARLMSLKLPLALLVVDDASPDGTGQLADELSRRYLGQFHVIHRAGKLGLGSAYRAGFAYAIEHGASVVGEMDADLSHNPQDLPRLWAVLEAGSEVVLGSRRVKGGKIEGWGPLRHLMSWGATTLSRLVLGLKTRDVTAGFRLYRITALDKVPWRSVTSNGYAWQEEILFWLERSGAKVVEVPVIFSDRSRGKSKLKLGDVIEFFGAVIRLALRS